MTLRNKLLMLLTVFAGYAILAAGVAIYGTQWRVASAVEGFAQTAGRTSQIESTRMLLAEQLLFLREVVNGHSASLQSYAAAREEFLARLHQLAAFSGEADRASDWSMLLELAAELEEASNRCLSLLDAGDQAAAATILADRIDTELAPSLRAGLSKARAEQDRLRSLAARHTAGTTAYVVGLTAAVGALAAVLLVIAAVLLHRWLFRPLADLERAVRRYGPGELAAGAVNSTQDELSRLSQALDDMARNLAESERKHRSLFANMQDAVVICDTTGRIVEYHDGATHVLGAEGLDHVGRPLLGVWPEWQSAFADWPAVLRGAALGRRFQAHDVPIPSPSSTETNLALDFVVCRVDCGTQSNAAIVVRDVTERRGLQARLRKAETMEAVGQMAGALAHDVNNLLTSVVGTLSVLAEKLADSPDADRINAALRTCRRATGLSKRLLNFAAAAHGSPQVFAPAEIIETIIDAMDPAGVEGLQLQTDLDRSLKIRMDQDQFAQIVLNLVRNAREAVRGQGRLRIELRAVVARSPDGGGEDRPFAMLVFEDSGSGIPVDVQRRLFEPFFSTKSPSNGLGRGMGLAIVQSAVSAVGGFVQVESRPGEGATFRVHLPLAEDPQTEPVESDMTVPAGSED